MQRFLQHHQTSPTGVAEFEYDLVEEDYEWIDVGMTFESEEIVWEVTSVVDKVVKCVVLYPPEKKYIGERDFTDYNNVVSLIKISHVD